MANMFTQAKTAEVKPAAKAKKADRPEVAIAGMDNLASIASLMKTLEALYATVESEVKEQMGTYFVKAGETVGKVPQNFRGIEGTSSASCELRKRSTRSPLSAEEVTLLTENGITYETLVDVKDCFVINPEHSRNEVLLEKVAKALESVPDLPADFIQHQDAVTRDVVTDESLNLVFSKKVAKDLLSVVGVLAIKPVVENTDVNDALVKVSAFINASK